MKTLRVLLKLFPRSFQNEMGEAWLEASETEIRHRQNAEGKKFSIVVAFAMETIFTVLPQAYNVGQSEISPSPQDFVPEKNKTIAQIVDFFNTWGIFHCAGMVVALHVIVASVYSPATILLGFWGFIVFALICMSYKKIYRWWVKNNKPIVSVLGGATVGFFSTFVFVFLMFMPGQMDAGHRDFAMYQDLKKQMGYDPKHPTNEWFEETQGYARVRPEHKTQWCALSRARLEGATAALQPGQDNMLSGVLLSVILADTYAQGCWDNEDLYIAQRHKMATLSTGFIQSENLFGAVDWMFVFKKIKEARALMRTKSLYSPQKYCLEYTAKNYFDKTGKFLQDTDLKETCEKFPENQSMRTPQAQAIRASSDTYIQKSMGAL